MLFCALRKRRFAPSPPRYSLHPSSLSSRNTSAASPASGSSTCPGLLPNFLNRRTRASQPLEFFQGRRGLATAVKQGRYTSSMILRSVRSGCRPYVSFRNCFCWAGLRWWRTTRYRCSNSSATRFRFQRNQPSLGPPALCAASCHARLLGDLAAVISLRSIASCVQDRLGDVLDDVELADLVACLGPQLLDDVGVKRRAVRGRDAEHAPTPFVQLPLELRQESCAGTSSSVGS